MGQALRATIQGKQVFIGGSFIDMELTAADGSKKKISDFVKPGTTTLIEFWASWCNPCRVEIPHMRNTYNKYHPKGLNIVSISIDSDPKNWHQALEEEKMPWEQLIDNTKAAFRAYNLSGVPSSILVNDKGKIIKADGWMLPCRKFMINHIHFKMRNFIFIILLSVVCSCSQQNNDDIVVDFNVQNMTYSKIAIVVSPEMIKETDLDKHGKASCTLQGNMIYARLFYGEEAKNVFFQKGDRVTISFDANNFKDSMKFEGKNTPVIEYLNSITYNPIIPPEYERSLKEIVSLVNEKTDEAANLLKARKLEAVNPEFAKLEEGRIKYSYLISLVMYPMGHIMFDTTYRPNEEYYSTLEKYVQEDESLIDLDIYREFIIEAALVLGSKDKEISGIYNKNVARMKYIAQHFKNDKLKQSLLNEIAIRQIKNGINHITELENIYNTYVTDPTLRTAYKTEYDKRNIAVTGKLSPDFQAKDINGKTYSLKDFKGKYLYIDMWATWCGPCKREMPYLKELEKKMEGKNITFLGLSTDEDKAAWEETVKSGELSGVQLLLGRGSQFQRDYNIDGIPHFILIDPDGKIINPKAVRPSSADAEKILNALPGI